MSAYYSGKGPRQLLLDHKNEPEGDPDLLNFHSLVPVPEEVLKAGYESAGYDWERANWGCKWGADETTILNDWKTGVIYEFYTAGSPRIEFLTAVAKQWSNLKLILGYEDSGMTFKGLAKFQGEIHEGHCISL